MRQAGRRPPHRGRARRDCDWRALVDELATLREESALLVTRLTDADLARGGHHPNVGFLRVGELLHEWVHHDRNHLRQILANVQACLWPHMGNAQRFSRP
ncbi:MAG: DinB family protein [Candidatus Rokubacteria bacterium]|nr:DinB family protein [Candidatus Rokubacteria bacterium]